MEEKKRWPLAYAPNSFLFSTSLFFLLILKVKADLLVGGDYQVFAFFPTFFFVCAKKPKD